jgi:hypothetical protein
MLKETKLILIFCLFNSLIYSQDSINITKHELRCFLRDYTNAKLLDSTIVEQDSIIAYQRTIINNDSINLSNCNTISVMQDNLMASYREAYESEQGKVIAEKKRKTLWQIISGVLGGLFIYKTIIP